MQPSRGPIQVTLEDTTGSSVQCKRPPAQVKILRRPKPVTDAVVAQSEAQISMNKPTSGSSSNSRLATNNGGANMGDCVFEERLLIQEPAKADKSLSGSSNGAQFYNKIVENGPANASAPVSMAAIVAGALKSQHHQQQQQHQQPHQTTQSHQTTSAPSQGSQQQQQHHHHHHHNRHHQQQQKSSPTATNNEGTKKLMKTYQERADEYAKARLRILGSAFPEGQ